MTGAVASASDFQTLRQLPPQREPSGTMVSMCTKMLKSSSERVHRQGRSPRGGASCALAMALVFLGSLQSSPSVAGAAAPWARLVEAKPLATNAAIVVDAFGYDGLRFEVSHAGNNIAVITPKQSWRRTRLPSEGQGRLFLVAPASGSWPKGGTLDIRVLAGEAAEPVAQFKQPVGVGPDSEAPRVRAQPFMGSQTVRTSDIPIFGQRTKRWVSFTQVDDEQSSRVLVKLELAPDGERTAGRFTHVVAPGSGFSVPLAPKSPYQFWGATLIDTAGNSTKLGRPPALKVKVVSKPVTSEKKGGCVSGTATSWPLAAVLGLLLWWLRRRALWLASR